jgi:translation initiation factor 5B
MPPKKTNNIAAQKAREHVERIRAEEARIKAEEDRIKAEELELERLETERLKKIEDDRLEKERLRREKKEKKKADGTYLTAKQKKDKARLEQTRSRGFATTADLKESVTVDQEDEVPVEIQYRSLIVCIQGHVDVGKTLLLDHVRGTRIQSSEAAGITQQIGASFKSKDSLPKADEILLPGFLFIDTPGHSAFTNLRKRGSSICDLIVIVVDVTHGIEQQTEESIQRCLDNDIPFIIALNKCDRFYGWDVNDTRLMNEKLEDERFRSEFQVRFTEFSTFFYGKEFNTSLEFSTEEDVINVCPISAMTGEGIDDLLYCCARYAQEMFLDDLVKTDELNAVIMESKRENRTGATIDVILINGSLSVGDSIGFSTLNGPVITIIRSLMMPLECTEMRTSQSYAVKRKVEGACGVRIVAINMDGAIPDSKIIRTTDITEIEDFSANIQTDDEGLTVYAPTLGQLEALLKFFRDEVEQPIKVGHANIGDVRRKDILHLTKYIENGENDKNIILCFDVEIEDAQEFITLNKTKVFHGDTIYRLYESYMEWFKVKDEIDKAVFRKQTVFPCELSLIRDNCFRKTNPMIIGVRVEKGTLYNGIKVFSKKGVLGTVIGIRNRDDDVDSASKFSEVSIKVDTKLSFGRDLMYEDVLYSYLTANSNKFLLEHFDSDLNEEDRTLLSRLSRVLKIN